MTSPSAHRLSERIGGEIRRLISAGELTLGDRLPSERSLAEQYGASRVVVREGLRGLEEAGLVEIRKGRMGGAFVTSGSSPVFTRTLRDMAAVGSASWQEMFEARAWIMDAAVRLACERRTDADLAALREALRRIRRRPRPDDDREQRTHEALEFNVIIARASGNAVLASFVKALIDALEELLRSGAPDSYAPIVVHFTRIVDGIDSRDAELATSAMSAYLRGIREAIPHWI
ncbi:FCD domain-containing protein [Microbacterium sp. NPDC096154]|uniref:FadR/GntR family transcriptional regulator n=1 Tax=Microbacterium sp. NPDC096154 TaxID=3155549 RepID=UPI00332E1A8F